MKKIFAAVLLFSILLSGCNSHFTSADLSQEDAGETTPEENTGSTETSQNVTAPSLSGEVVVINEKMFIAQTNDIYSNTEDYLGKTIKYEGFLDVYENTDTGELHYSVVRYMPGCCGMDANAGFAVKWNNEYPEANDWVEAVGVLQEYEEGGIKFLHIELSSMTVLPTRGAEYVYQ